MCGCGCNGACTNDLYDCVKTEWYENGDEILAKYKHSITKEITCKNLACSERTDSQTQTKKDPAECE